MTLLTREDDRKRPGVHALLVGVGAYPYMHKWSELPEVPGNLSTGHQLSSPYHSVEALAQWLRDDLRVHDAPLRSLRVLASGSATVPGRYTAPTLDAIKTSCRAWFDDAHEHEENIALFYFCGHGLTSGQVWALLADDFGLDTVHEPFEATFEPNLLVDGMQKCRAGRQLFMIDACSRPSPRAKRFKNFRPRDLISFEDNENLAKQTLILASEFGTQAFGQRKGVSLFMEGFLAAVRGGATEPADEQPDTWVVKANALKRSINHAISKRPGGSKQEVSFGKVSTDFEFHELAGEPIVPVQVKCLPSEYEASSTLEVALQKRHVLEGLPWTLDLPYGTHDFHAVEEQPRGRKVVHGSKLDVPVVPPFAKVSIRCGDE